MSGIASGVRPEQRFSRSNPCPICGGYDGMRRGEGKRCYGFISDDGEWARCTREEHAGDAPFDERSGAFVHKLTGDCRCGVRHDLRAREHRNDATMLPINRKSRITETYDYTDEGGELLYQTVRREPKDFWQRRPDGNGGWIWKMEDVRRVLYQLPELLAADPNKQVLVLEGEKDVDRARAMGFIATTNVGGAGKWRTEYSDVLRGREVAIIADNDTDGRRHAEKVAHSLYSTAASVKVVQLPGVPEGGGDLCDWLDAGGTAEKLRKLIDDTPEWRPAAETRMRFKTAREIAQETPTETEWAVHGYAAFGAITKIDGKVKAAGKTTFLSHMAGSMLDGKAFLGGPTSETKIVWLTEQPPTSFRKVLERAGLTERDDLYVLHWHDAAGVEWEEVVEAAKAKAAEVGARTLFVDTLAQFAGIQGDGENNAGEAQKTMQPLQQAAAEDLAVVTTSHERKGGGEVGESGRGSSAFGGAVDIILSIRRADGNVRPTVRVIESLSRFDETPDKLVVELTDDGYTSLGDATAFAEREARDAILDVLPAKTVNAMTTDDLLDKLKEHDIKRTSAQTALAALIDARQVVRVGEGKRGDPYRHYKPEKDSADPKGELAAERKNAADDAANAAAQNVSAATPVPSGGKKDAVLEGAASENEKLSAATSTYRSAERNDDCGSWPNDPMKNYPAFGKKGDGRA